ncbi:condensation domain-containing protein [Streptomyces albireticuli]|nr:condensation domain-containing protein [Streptomyces albireticuli]
MRHHQVEPSAAGPADAELPLLAAQAGILYAQELAPDNPVYNTGDRVEITGPLDEELFARALRRTAREAETLSLLATPGGADTPPAQRLTGTETELHRVDLRDAADPRAEAERWMREDLDRPVDLTRGPLVTQALLRLADERYWWYQRVHHFAVDAYALTLIGRRTAEIYTALAAGEEPSDNPFGTLRELVADEAEYLASPRHTADRDFWRTHLADRPEPVSLSTRPAARVGQAAGRQQQGEGGGRARRENASAGEGGCHRWLIPGDRTVQGRGAA